MNGFVHTPLVGCWLQLAKLLFSCDFFRWEKLRFVNEIPPQTNADSHEFYCLCCWIFYIDVESILNVFDVSIACRNKNYRSVLSSTHCLLLVAASENRSSVILFRWEKLNFVNEISPQTNADSHKFYCLSCWIFYISVESILNVFDVSIAWRNENYPLLLSVRVCVVQTVAALGHVYAVRWCFAYAETNCVPI